MKKIIIILIIVSLFVVKLAYSGDFGVSRYTNLNEKIAYTFIKGVSQYSKQNRILGTLVFGSVSAGFFCGYLAAEDKKIKSLCLTESAVFLIFTPIIFLLKSENEKLILQIDNNRITPMRGFRKWRNYLLTGRIIGGSVLTLGGGYLAYKGIEWVQNDVYKKNDYKLLYLLGFALAAEGIYTMFMKTPDEHFYDSLKENKSFVQNISPGLFVYNDNYYGGFNYKF